MQMAYIWSPSYKKHRGFEDDDSRVTVNTNSMTVRSQDGLKITLEIALHYKAGVSLSNKTQLLSEFADMYTRFGDPVTSWKSLINKVTITAVNAACQRFQSFDFFRAREGIIEAMEQETKDNLLKLGFTLIRLNVLNVDVPTKFNAAVKKTQIVKQNQEKYNYTKAIEDIKGTTRVKSELMDREILVSRVNAEANATAILTTAEALSIQTSLAIEREMVRNVKGNLSRTDNQFLLDFVWIRLLEKKITEGTTTQITMDMPSFS